jgi:aconitase A
VCVGAVRQPQLQGRINPDVKMNYLASPSLVIAPRASPRNRWAWTVPKTYGMTGITTLNDGQAPRTVRTVHVTARNDDGACVEFDSVVRIDTPGEADYYRNGGILQYVLCKMTR